MVCASLFEAWQIISHLIKSKFLNCPEEIMVWAKKLKIAELVGTSFRERNDVFSLKIVSRRALTVRFGIPILTLMLIA